MKELRQEKGQGVSHVAITAFVLGLVESFEGAGRRGGNSQEATAIAQVRDET